MKAVYFESPAAMLAHYDALAVKPTFTREFKTLADLDEYHRTRDYARLVDRDCIGRGYDHTMRGARR